MLQAQDATGTTYSFGSGEHLVRAVKREKGWVIETPYQEVFTDKGKWFYEPTASASILKRIYFPKPKALELAKAQAQARAKKIAG